MAVLYGWRGRGVGSALLHRLKHCAQDSGLQRVYVHARLEVAGFYSRAGFQAAGQPFPAADIPHIEMRKVLLPAEVVPAGTVDPEISRD